MTSKPDPNENFVIESDEEEGEETKTHENFELPPAPRGDDIPPSIRNDDIQPVKAGPALDSEEVARDLERNRKLPAHERWINRTRVPEVSRALIRDSLPLDKAFSRQRWALVTVLDSSLFKSVTEEKSGKRFTGRLLKISGVYDSKEDAFRYYEILRTRNPHFSIHRVPVFEWVPIDDDLVDTSEEDERLVLYTVMDRYLKEQEKERQRMAGRIMGSALDIPSRPDNVDSKDHEDMPVQEAFTNVLPEDQFPTHLPRPDRDEEATRFFAKALHEVNHPELYEPPKPSEDAVKLSFDEAREIINDKEKVEKLKKSGVVLKLLPDDTSGMESVFLEQKFVVVSFIQPEEFMSGKKKKLRISSPDTTINFGGCLLKVRGAFHTLAGAENLARQLVSEELYFDTFVVKNFHWSLMSDTDCDERSYGNALMEEIMNGYREQKDSLKYSIERQIARAGNIQAPGMANWDQFIAGGPDISERFSNFAGHRLIDNGAGASAAD